MTKYKEVDYKGPKSRWPLWVIPFLVAILLLLIGIFIFVTLGARHHCLFFDCEQRIDDGGLVPPDQKPRKDDEVFPPSVEPGSSRGMKNETEKSDSPNEITVHGELMFEASAPDSLPANSSLEVKFEDVSYMDASSTLLGKNVVDLSGYNKATHLRYEIKCRKPDPHGSYSLSAVLNVGWQANKNSWIQQGDYHTDTYHAVKIEDGKNDYKKDITLARYN